MALMMDLLFPWGVQVGKNTQTLEKLRISPIAEYMSILSWNGPFQVWAFGYRVVKSEILWAMLGDR